MKKLLLTTILSAAVFIVQAGAAHAFDPKGGQDCTKCHTLNSEEASGALKSLAPDIKILEVKAGPINGLWEVALEAGGRKGILYLDYSKKKVIINGNIVDLQTKTSFTKESFDKINKVDVALIPYDKALVMGEKDARIKVAVFDDPD